MISVHSSHCPEQSNLSQGLFCRQDLQKASTVHLAGSWQVDFPDTLRNSNHSPSFRELPADSFREALGCPVPSPPNPVASTADFHSQLTSAGKSCNFHSYAGSRGKAFPPAKLKLPLTCSTCVLEAACSLRGATAVLAQCQDQLTMHAPARSQGGLQASAG